MQAHDAGDLLSQSPPSSAPLYILYTILTQRRCLICQFEICEYVGEKAVNESYEYVWDADFDKGVYQPIMPNLIKGFFDIHEK